MHVTKTFASFKVFFMYSFTHSNTLFLSRHLSYTGHKRWLADEVFKWWYFFPFLGASFSSIPSSYLISYEVQTRYWKTLKYSEQYIRDHLLGTKVRIWICSEYDAVFSFSCITSCNLTKSFTFSFTSFLSKESYSKSFKQSTCTLYASEILLFKIFKMRVSWQVKC